MTLFVFRLNTALYSSELLKLHTGWSVMLCLFLSSSFRPSPFLCKPWYLFPFFSFFFFPSVFSPLAWIHVTLFSVHLIVHFELCQIICFFQYSTHLVFSFCFGSHWKLHLFSEANATCFHFPLSPCQGHPSPPHAYCLYLGCLFWIP